MAEGGLKGSRSVEGLDKPGKPGKLSSDFLNKFVSDPSLSGPQPSTVGHSRLSGQSFTSSSEEIAMSQENIKSINTTVRIKIPDHNEGHMSPSSGDEDMLSDEESGKDKKKKKRKYRWKWSPFKKMRKFFRRKKSPTRAKSCEELPRERYKPTNVASEEDDNSLRSRTKSEPSLVETKTKSPLAAIEVYERRNTVDNPVQRTKSEPSRQSLGRLLKNVKVQGKSQDSISEEPPMSSDEQESQAGSMTTGLDWTMISSDSGTEAAVSFESLPRASSLEGLQAAHDRIKIAPKHRRPPTRAHPNSTSMNIKRNPIKPHRRSKTDPSDLSANTNTETEANEELASKRNSDVVNTTIFEALESSEEQSKEKVKTKASDILAKVQESPRVGKRLESGTSTRDEVLPDAVEEKEDHSQSKREKNKEAAEQHVKELDENEMDNKDNVVINKENEHVQPNTPDVLMENKEESKTKETVLKELNVKKDVSRPLLDMSRRTKSLTKNFQKKESGTKPPLPNRFSLDSIEQHIDNTEEQSATYLVQLRKFAEKEKPNKAESVHEQKSQESQNSSEEVTPADVSHVQSEVSTPSSLMKSLDADKTLTGTKLKDKPTEQNNTSNQPDWIKLATKKSERLSQLLDSKDVQASLNMDTDSSSSPTVASDNKGNQLKPAVKEKPKIPIKPKALTNNKNSPDAPHFRGKTSNIKIDKKAPFLSEEKTSKDKALDQVSSTGKNVSSDKCVVCGTTVYQMEKCNFDSSVLHRRCVKCSVCKRLLTVGNFVITESKVYCKPHGQATSVSL